MQLKAENRDAAAAKTYWRGKQTDAMKVGSTTLWSVHLLKLRNKAGPEGAGDGQNVLIGFGVFFW